MSAKHTPKCEMEGCGCKGKRMTINAVTFVCPHGCTLKEFITDHPLYEQAPSLLAALEGLQQFEGELHGFLERFPECKKYWKAANAAIKRAKKGSV